MVGIQVTLSWLPWSFFLRPARTPTGWWFIVRILPLQIVLILDGLARRVGPGPGQTPPSPQGGPPA